MIVIGGNPSDNRQAFEQLEQVGRTSCDLCMAYQPGVPIYVGRG